MEYWNIGKTKTQHRSQVILNISHRDSPMHRAYERLIITPILHHSFELLPTESIISDLAQRT